MQSHSVPGPDDPGRGYVNPPGLNRRVAQPAYAVVQSNEKQEMKVELENQAEVLVRSRGYPNLLAK